MIPTDRLIVGSLCYLFEGERVLLLRRNRHPHLNKWTAPGGKMELGESPDECVMREIREETGFTITKPTLRGIVTVTDIAFPVYWMLFIYECREFTGELIPCEEGELAWLPIKDLAQYPLPQADQFYLPRLLRETGIFQAKITYDTPEKCIASHFIETY